MQDLSGFIDVLDKIMSNNRNDLATRFISLYKNKKIIFKFVFFIYLLALSSFVMDCLLLINNKHLDILITNKGFLLALKVFSTLFKLCPFNFMIFYVQFKMELLSPWNYFIKSIRKYKKIYIKIKRANFFRKFKKSSLKFILIELIGPFILAIICTASLYWWNSTISIAWIIAVIICLYIIANHFEKYYSVSFVVKKIYDTFPNEKIINSEIINIGSNHIYVNISNNIIILFDQKYIEFKEKMNLFCYMVLSYVNKGLKECIKVLKEDFSEMKDENEQEKYIKELNNIESKIEEILE